MEEKTGMAFDSIDWGILPGREEDEFILAFRDLNDGPGELTREFGPLSETELRGELKRIEAAEVLVDVRVAKAKEDRKK
jgi:DNA mismatch repair ATPase MutS